MRFTAKERLETWGHASRVQSDEDTYDIERTVVGSVVAGVTADRCGQCGACDRYVVSVAVGNREAGDVAITEAAYAEAQMEIERLRTALENQRRECDRAWREVDAMAAERKVHARWRAELADKLHDAETELMKLRKVASAFKELHDNAEEWECDGLGLWAQHGLWEAVDEAMEAIAPNVELSGPKGLRRSSHES